MKRAAKASSSIAAAAVSASKTKRAKTAEGDIDIEECYLTCTKHSFTSSQQTVVQIRSQLLDWYDQNKRDLPWRDPVPAKDDVVALSHKAYRVLVSEIMLQQTQVATVMNYYRRWIAKWPTAEALAEATVEDVNEMWTGLGYYARGRRLREAAIVVKDKLSGRMPSTAIALQRELPGVGPYTAGAVASIVYNEQTAAVDGNVIRVLTRLGAIAGDSTSKDVIAHLWKCAQDLVDPTRPGDFNQALMELGALVCTPKAPKCSTCPIRTVCLAYAEQDASPTTEIDTSTPPSCDWCVATAPSVTFYPNKKPKTAPREESYTVFVLQSHDGHYLLTRRPETGLLAGLWEFPSLLIAANEVADNDEKPVGVETTPKKKEKKKMNSKSNTESNSPSQNFATFILGLPISNFTETVTSETISLVHVFSHIRHTYTVVVGKCERLVNKQLDSNVYQWSSAKDIGSKVAMSTGMKKVFKRVCM